MLNVSKPTLRLWLSQETYEERRGWTENRKRKYTNEEEQRVVSIKKEMIDRDDYLLGAEQVQMHYEGYYPGDRLPTEWFISEVVRNHNLQTRTPRERTRGRNIVARLLFPIQSIVTLGRIQQASDFIGKKFITGRTEPITLFSTGYYQWLKLYQVVQTKGETATAAMNCLHNIWTTYPIPDVMRIDNGMTFRGTGRVAGTIGRFLKFLLNAGVTPLFSAPYQSYTNPHIEGGNSTFTQKLWKRKRFTNADEIDRECARFNAEHQRFCNWKFKERLAQKSLRYMRDDRLVPTESLHSTKGKKICFIRFVQSWTGDEERYGIVLLDYFVDVPSEYNNQYVFVELNLQDTTLYVYQEREGVKIEILSQPFPVTL